MVMTKQLPIYLFTHVVIETEYKYFERYPLDFTQTTKIAKELQINFKIHFLHKRRTLDFVCQNHTKQWE